ncbi:MAG: dephospho-CoA kinase [Dehalococcoidia bacterium]|nr:MAG: dephospho-CoA kinase [Dehalococcoidia bacterium]
MIVIGLTGGIASGKSAVSGMLEQWGAVVIDADKVGHEAFLPDTDAWREVVATFGSEILDENGKIDRSKLADIVFRDPDALLRLNSIMHPLMYRIVEHKIEALRDRGVDVVVLEAPLLIEAKWTDLVDQVWVVVAPESNVIDRLCNQKGFTEEQAKARINSQTTSSEKSKYADVVIENDSDLGSLREKLEDIWRRLRSSAGD